MEIRRSYNPDVDLDNLFKEINGGLDSANIKDGSIVNADINTSAGILLSKLLAGGWIEANETWTFSSADGATGVITIPSDGTTKYSNGMRIKLTQTTDKYFIVTAVAATSLTVWGGTDYTLANATITSPFFSYHKEPFGFPATPIKWMVQTTDTANRTQAPAAGTWYNLNSNNIVVPIGVWRLGYKVELYGTTGAGGTQADVFVTLSSANNSESDATYTARAMSEIGASKEHAAYIHKEQLDTFTSKGTRYLNTKANVANMGLVGNLGGTTRTELFAISAYL